MSRSFAKRDQRFVGVKRLFFQRFLQNTLLCSCLCYGHCDSNRCGIARRLGPWMVGNCHSDGNRLFRLEMASDHASRKLLCNAICGDEAESAKGCAFASQQLGGVIPPKHHEVGTTGNIGMNFPYSFGIFIAELLAEILPCSKGRIADDVIRLRPFWPFRVLVAIDLDLVSFRVCSCDGLASVIERQFLRVAGEHGVRDLNRLEIAENRLGRHPAARAKMPLQKADPEHQFGDRRRAGIDFKSQ
jgi:hypothetical protein